MPSSPDTPHIQTCIHFDWADYYIETTEKQKVNWWWFWRRSWILFPFLPIFLVSPAFTRLTSTNPKLWSSGQAVIKRLRTGSNGMFLRPRGERLRKQYLAHRSPKRNVYLHDCFPPQSNINFLHVQYELWH